MGTFHKKKGFNHCHVGVLVGVGLLLGLVCGLIGHFATDCSCKDIPAVPTTTTDTPIETTSPPEPTSPPRDYRLGSDVLPYHYEVQWRPDIYTTSTYSFHGFVVMYLYCNQSTSKIQFNVKKLNFSVDELWEVENTEEMPPQVVRVEEEEDIQVVTLWLDRDLIPGKNYALNMSFSGPLLQDLAGLYLDSYVDHMNQTHYLALTQFAASDARKAFPCLDEPKFKATFNVTVVRKNNRHALSNMPLLYTEERDEEWYVDHFMTSPPMSTYTLAIIVSDFTNINQTTKHGDLVRVWVTEGSEHLVEYALQIAVKTQEEFTDYMNMSAGVPKMDHVAVPNFNFGAMENWGLVIYRETNLLYVPEESTSQQRRRVAIIISHEVSHQWVGNQVTCEWWTEVMVNEGLASYFESRGLATAEPTWDRGEQLLVRTEALLDQDAQASSQPIAANVTRPQEHNGAYSYMAYNKGAFILRMVEGFLSERVFQHGMQLYMKKFRYQAASIHDLWDAMTVAAQEHNVTEPSGSALDVKVKMDTWVLQMGYPLIWVEKNGEDTITLNQSHYLLEPNATISKPSPYNYTWHVPITYSSSAEPDTHLFVKKWLGRNNDSMVVQNVSWIVLNTQRRGLYRIHYNSQLRQDLINQFMDNASVIDHFSRAQFIDDLFTLTRSGEVDFLDAMEITRYLHTEQSYLPWAAAVTHLNTLTRLLRNLPVFTSLQKYVLEKIDPLYEYIGWKFNLNGNIIENYLRALTLKVACFFNHEDCIKTASTRYQAWRDDSVNETLHPDEKNTVLCSVVREGALQVFWEVLEYVTQSPSTFRSTLIESIACSQHVWLLQSLLSMSLDETHILHLHRQDVFNSVAKNTAGGPLVLDYLYTNWDDTPLGNGKYTILKEVANGMFSKYHLAQLELLLSLVSSSADITAVQNAIKQTSQNKAFIDANLELLEEWLEKQLGSSNK